MRFPFLLFLFLAIEVAIVAFIDFRTKKISNYWTLSNLFIFIIFALFFRDLFHINWNTLLFPLAFLGVGFILFALKIMGGGDSKFLFSYFLLIPEPFHELYFIDLARATVVIGLTLFILNSIKNFAKLRVAISLMDPSLLKGVYGTKFAYAPVMAIAWIIFGWDIRNIITF